MEESSLILFECSKINATLHKPINTTQRIKYTCLSVSSNYIVLGSTCGSLYLFTRDPCTFQQLIPLSEGAVTQVQISPDEKLVALATTRGCTCLVTLKLTAKLVAVSTEHLGERITCLCWHENSSEIYIGDDAGKVSIMMHSIFTVNGMFQVPSCILMHLDSCIVQMDFASPLLLISTLTRCYICDTVLEQYKQIGNKARDGKFGACFYKSHTQGEDNASIMQQEKRLSNRMGSFSLIAGNDGNVIEEHYPKIYCARPGSRLWEVTANGTVVKTHQFREALAIPPSVTYKLCTQKSPQVRRTDQTWHPQSVNFSHLFVISCKYLFSYTTNGLYIIDPISATVVQWNDEFTNVAMAHVVEDKIYLMTYSGVFHCLMFTSIDTLMLQFYDNKRYSECLQACIMFRSELLKFANTKDITRICDIDSKLNVSETEISIELLPLITLIKSNLNYQPIKLDSGIVVVNSKNRKMKNERNNRNVSATKSDVPSTSNEELPVVQEFKFKKESLMQIVNLDKLDNLDTTRVQQCNVKCNEIPLVTECSINSLSNTQSPQQIFATEEKNKKGKESEANKQKSNAFEDATYNIQNELVPVYSLINNIKLVTTNGDIENFILEVHKKMNNVKEAYEEFTDLKTFLYEVLRTAKIYYSNALLQNSSVDLLHTTRSKQIVDEIVKCFIDLNELNHKECLCGFPYPSEKLNEPKFIEIGKAVLRRLINEDTESCINLCKKVPYMWQEYLTIYINERHDFPDDVLHQCVQTNDNVILSIILSMASAKQWKSIVGYLKNMEKGVCLSCNKIIEKKVNQNNLLIDWSGIAQQIMKREGPDAAMTFLLKLQLSLPSVSFERSIFQNLIFTKLLEYRGMKHSVDFNRNCTDDNKYSSLCSLKIRDQLVRTLEKDLEKPVGKNILGSGTHDWGIQYKPKSSICPCCTLSLQTPVLLGNNGISLFPCGHAYHVNCLIQKKLLRCNLHDCTNS